MKNLRVLFTPLVFVAVLFLHSCMHPPGYNPHCVAGCGSIVTEEFMLDDFVHVVNKTVVNVEIVQGENYEVLVEGYENMIDNLELRVVNQSLRIGFRRGCFNNINLKMYIVMPTIESVVVESTGRVELGAFEGLGSLNLKVRSTGNIRGNGLMQVNGLLDIESRSTGNIVLDVEALDVNTVIESTGNVTLSGSCINQYVETRGTGVYKAFDMYSEVSTIYSNGIGNVNVFASKELDVTINSIGSVYYKGDPENLKYTLRSIGKLYDAN